jgi:hypothetical protein
LNESVSEAAAKTEIVPLRGVTVGEAVPVPPQAVSSATTTKKVADRLRIRILPQLRGSSITTLVDFTDATAITPGFKPSSSADSRVISDTIRYGPACSST